MVTADRIARSALQLAETLLYSRGRWAGPRQAGRAEDTRLGLIQTREESRVGGRPTAITPELLERAPGAPRRRHLHRDRPRRALTATKML